MRLVEHGTSGSHWGNDDEVVIHHRGGGIQLTREKAAELWIILGLYLDGGEPPIKNYK